MLKEVHIVTKYEKLLTVCYLITVKSNVLTGLSTGNLKQENTAEKKERGGGKQKLLSLYILNPLTVSEDYLAQAKKS